MRVVVSAHVEGTPVVNVVVVPTEGGEQNKPATNNHHHSVQEQHLAGASPSKWSDSPKRVPVASAVGCGIVRPMYEPEETKCVFVEGLEVFAHHGFTAEEQQLGHRFRFDLEVQVPADSEWGIDSFADTVDYVDLAAIVQEVAAGGRVRLVETLAARVLDLVEERLPHATGAR
ncbi:MAG: hypothetical protein C4340_02155, partial [Armatimonadota bacterium]